jgi:hypothetical protein
MTWSPASGLVILLIAQMIADFAVRREILSAKNARPRQAMWVHLAVFFGTSSVLVALLSPDPELYMRAQVACAAATAVHLALDWLFGRAGMWNAEVGAKQRWLFVTQQGFKTLSALTLAEWACPAHSWPPEFLGACQLRNQLWLPVALGLTFGYIFSIFAGDAFVSLVLTKLSWNAGENGESNLGAGRLIGVFEAILITTFVIAHQYAAIGVVLAAKSVARYEWLKDKQGMAEYFLVGTLANLTWSMLGGILTLLIAGWSVFSA